MNPIQELEQFLLDNIADGEDAVEIGKDIGRLQAGSEAINKIIARPGFWDDYQAWKIENE